MDELFKSASAIFDHEVARSAFYFSLAAWIHSGRVKREIANQGSTAITAINNLGNALRQELSQLNTRVGILEKKER